MLTDLAGGRLAHVNIGQLGAMRRRHRAFQIEQHVHRYAPRSNRRRRLRPALAGVAVPPASPAVVVLSVPSPATISAPRSAVDPAMPARTAGSAVWPDVSSNLSPAAIPTGPCTPLERLGAGSVRRRRRFPGNCGATLPPSTPDPE